MARGSPPDAGADAAGWSSGWVAILPGQTLTLTHSLGGAVEEGIQVDRNQLISHWSRVAYVAWRDFLNLPARLSVWSWGDPVLTLKMFMHDLGYKNMDITPAYDEKTALAIKQVQRKHGIPVDGVVGPLTKIVLYSEKAALNIPRLADQGPSQ